MKITSWSYSRLACYETCPAQFKYRFIDKLPEPTSDALQRGNDVHTSLANYLTGKAEMPEVAAPLRAVLTELRAYPDKVVEKRMAFTEKWRPTGYFSKDTRVRVIWDAGVVYPDDTGEVIDHKTGKFYDSNSEQVELFALSMGCQYPHIRHVTTRLWYVDSGDEIVAEFDATEFDALKQKWTDRAVPMFNDTVFAPRPNDKCHFCNFAKGNGGPCKFG